MSSSDSIDILFLGTASAIPSKGRRLPSILVRIKNEFLLLDCGEGAQYQILSPKSRFKVVNKKLYIPVSHLHGDHALGVPGLLLSLGLSGRRRDLTILGPRGLKSLVLRTLKLLDASLPYPLNLYDVKDGFQMDFSSFTIRAVLGRHSTPNYAYRIDEFSKPGKFHPDKAMKLGVPRGPLWKKLQLGIPVVVNDRVIRPEDVVDPPVRGLSLGYSGDTRPTSKIIRFFKNVDVLIFESTYAGRDRDKAVTNLHSTSIEAAEVARKCGARYLILTHFSSRYESVDKMLEEARSIFPNTFLAKEGRLFTLSLHGLVFRDEPID